MELIEIEDLVDCEFKNEGPIANVSGSLSYSDFFNNFLATNTPSIFEDNVTENWLCRSRWIDSSNAPNFIALQETFGKTKVPVTNCRGECIGGKEEMTMDNYLNYWNDYKDNNYRKDDPLLYLKDWHCKKNSPDLEFYQVLPYFASDWLNEYCTENQLDDYMFVYMGPKGSWTPFHMDVMKSYSWSANIAGRKRWLFLPPGEEEKLNKRDDQLPSDSSDVKDLLDSLNVRFYDVVQNPGQVIFVPSGWHHQVWNLEDTISVNHNWFNSCNVFCIWRALFDEFSAVTREIEDCKDMEDWDQHCQLMLRTSYGMDFQNFYNLLIYIARKRLLYLKEDIPVTSFDKYQFGVNHCKQDVRQIVRVLNDFHMEIDRLDISKIFNLDEALEDKLRDCIF